MLTQKAKDKAKVLIFWEKHGLEATIDAFPVKRSALFEWKRQLKEGQGKLISLNEKKRTPKRKRKRIWPFEVIQKIKEIRHNSLHPNLLARKRFTPCCLHSAKKKTCGAPSRPPLPGLLPMIQRR